MSVNNFAVAGRTQQGLEKLPNLNTNFGSLFNSNASVFTGFSGAPLDTSAIVSNATKATADTATKLGGEATKGFDWFGKNGIIGSTGAALNGIASVWGAYNSFTQGKQQLKEMRRQNDLLEKQYNTEVERYNKREAERDASNSYFQTMANNMYEKYRANYGNTNTGASADNSQASGANAGETTQNPSLNAPQEQEQKLLPTERE